MAMQARHIGGSLVFSLLLVACGSGPSDGASRTTFKFLAGSTISPVVSFSDYRDNYQVVRNADGTVSLSKLSEATVATYSSDTRTLRFADRFISFDDAGIPGQAYRLYQAASGQSLTQISRSFHETALQYPSLTGYAVPMSDADVVNKIYYNIFGRMPAGAEQTRWTTALTAGKRIGEHWCWPCSTPSMPTDRRRIMARPATCWTTQAMS